MLETDAPYMAPEPYRGMRCDSSFIPFMAEAVARFKDIPAEEVLRVTCENGKKFFSLSP